MALTEVDGPAGAPWERPLAGALDRLVVESELLAGNPLGDPARRPLYVYRPPGVELDHPRPLPTVYVIQGYTGQLDMWANRDAVRAERCSSAWTRCSPPAAARTRSSSSSTAGPPTAARSSSTRPRTGPYQYYLCDEVVPFVDDRYPTAADRDRRGHHRQVVRRIRGDGRADDAPRRLRRPRLARRRRAVRGLLHGRTSGRRRASSATTSRAPTTSSSSASPRRRAVRLRDVRRARSRPTAYAACYSPDPEHPGKALLPFEIETGRLIDEVWERWLGAGPGADGAATCRRAALDAPHLPRRRHAATSTSSTSARQAFAAELDKLGVEHTLELFDGKHGGLTYRYPGAIRELVLALGK